MANNDEKEIEHPKTMLEVMEGTRGAVEGYAQTQGIPETEAALILILNEMRCIHWHLDATMAEKEEVKK
ncbi:hypothetical protein ES708_18171 [subsurface metagenome]